MKVYWFFFLKKNCFLAVLSFTLMASAALAEPLALFGTVGGAPVFMTLERDGGTLSGWYYYLRHGKGLMLKGTIDANHVALDEFDARDGRPTGRFNGTTGWSGTWHGPDGNQFAFALHRAGVPADLTGQLRCRTIQAEPGYVFSSTVNIAATNGRLTRFDLSQHVNNDEAMCDIDMSSLTQIAASTEILLRAKDDDPADTSSDARHCSFHIVGDADYLAIRSDGCRGAGTTMFCSPRGGWFDVVINRKTHACATLE